MKRPFYLLSAGFLPVRHRRELGFVIVAALRILNGIPEPAEALEAEAAETAEAEPEAEARGKESAAEEPDALKELYWYQKMADEGLITREQFERKKRELLG